MEEDTKILIEKISRIITIIFGSILLLSAISICIPICVAIYGFLIDMDLKYLSKQIFAVIGLVFFPSLFLFIIAFSINKAME
jgi:hypothetical protein